MGVPSSECDEPDRPGSSCSRPAGTGARDRAGDEALAAPKAATVKSGLTALQGVETWGEQLAELAEEGRAAGSPRARVLAATRCLCMMDIDLVDKDETIAAELRAAIAPDKDRLAREIAVVRKEHGLR